ncbi:MAG TPA: terminase gpA endonuclease subunit [Pyrinomonadaceae bacterium]|jgi:phage terminase large subunit GpA-like protein
MRNLGQLVSSLAEIFRPPERLTLAQAAHKYMRVHNPPAYTGPYLPEKTPYMVEPANSVTSREHTALIFVGPAQSGKTEALVLAPVAYSVKSNPMDVGIYHTSQSSSRDFSRRRIDRMHRHSPDIGAELIPGQHSDNTHDKTYRSGMMLSIAWPSINEMSSKPLPLAILTDYDRMDDDIGGEGSPFLLAQGRTKTFRKLGMTVVESSPGRDIEQEQDDGTGERREMGAHEAPPCKGILALYNNSNRCRWYWPCPECGEFFEGSFSALSWLTTKEVDGKKVKLTRRQMLDSVCMICPANGCKIDHTSKIDMNRKGVWLAEGETIDKDGVRHGTPRESETLGYWLKGTAATYSTWRDLVNKYLDAEETFERTGDQQALKTTTNTDQGEPYEVRGAGTLRLAQDLEDRALDLPVRVVPPGVRALVATMDTQGNRWEVQVHGILAGRPYDTIVIDRFKIEKSERLDADGDRLWVKPASHPEDWNLITEEVINKTYPLATGDGHMAIAYTVCDSGGGKGRSHDKKSSIDGDFTVTSNAYAYWRELKKLGLHDRFFLLKGDPNLNAPRAHVEFPDSQRKDRQAGARGEIPVLFLNVNSLKDTLNARLERKEGSGGRIDYPKWLPRWWFEELVAEQRGRRGWVKIGSRRNEAWDLLTYFIGVCVWRRVEFVDWTTPPAWLAPWEENPHITWTEKKQAPVDKRPGTGDLAAKLGAELA